MFWCLIIARDFVVSCSQEESWEYQNKGKMSTMLVACFTYGCSQSTAQDLKEVYFPICLAYSAVLLLRFIQTLNACNLKVFSPLGRHILLGFLKVRNLQMSLLKITDVLESEKYYLVCFQRSTLFEFYNKHNMVLIVFQLFNYCS